MQVIGEKKLENATIEMQIEVPESRIEVEYRSVFDKIAKDVQIDGFRKGKAPLYLVENRYKSTADREVLENILRYTYIEALKEKNHAPISDPVFDWQPLDRGKPFSYKVKFEVAPTIQLGEYKGIEVTQRACEVREEDIDREIEVLVYRHAKISQKEAGLSVENGNQVKILMRRIDNIPADEIENQEFKDFTFVCGKSAGPLAMDPHALGMKVDEQKEVTFEYPKDYEISDLAGQQVTYQIKVAEINNVELPAVDDEFAKDLGEYASLAELRNGIRENLTKYIDDVIRHETITAIMKEIVEKSTFDIPETLIRNEMNMIFERLKSRIGVPANNIGEFALMMGLDPEEMSARLREDATTDIKSFLARLEIARKEEIKVTDEQYSEMVVNLATRYGKTPEEMTSILDENNMKANMETDLLLKNTQNFLIENAKISKEKAVTLEEFMKKPYGN